MIESNSPYVMKHVYNTQLKFQKQEKKLQHTNMKCNFSNSKKFGIAKNVIPLSISPTNKILGG